MGSMMDMTVGQAQAVLMMKSERFVRLAKMFGLERELSIDTPKHGLARVTQGAPFPDGSQYRPYESLSQAYIDSSGDEDIRYFGKNFQATQIAGLPTFENSLANLCNMLLMRDYAPTNYRWSDLATSITSPRDFRPVSRVRIKYVPDLPDLTEDQPFPDTALPPSDDEAVSYSVNEKGAYLIFTRKVIINDEIGAVQRAVEQLARAASRTLAKRVWNMFISNATYQPDGLPVFHANHGNLGNAALSAPALTAARNAIFAQTESNSTDLLGLGGGPLLLAIPIQLEATALPLNHVHWLELDTAGATGTPVLNPWIHRFGKGDENIFSNPLFTDQNDWMLFDISGNVQVAEVGFLQGSQNPQIVQSSPYTDSEFTQDRVTYKMRHEYECAILDYRGCYKSVVA